MKKYFELIKNTFLFAIANISGKLISFFLLPLYTYYLTTEQYATLDIANVIQGLVWPIISLSIAESVLRFALDKNENKKAVFTNGCLIIIPGIFIIVTIFPFIDFKGDINNYKIYLIMYFLTISLNTFLGVFIRTIDKVKLIVLNSTISTFIIAITNILLLTVFNLGLQGYFISLILGNGLSILIYIVNGKLWSYFSLHKIDKNLIKRMTIYSIPLIPNAIFWWINCSLDKVFLTSMIGLQAVGLYSVASKIPSILNIATSIFQQAWSISAVKEIDSEDTVIFFTNIYRIYSFIIIILSAICIAFTKPLASFLFSKDFYTAWTIVPVLVFSFYYASLNIYYGSIFTAAKKTKLIFYTTGTGAIVNILLNYIFILKLGLIGAAISTCISNFIVYVVRLKGARKIIDIKISAYNEILKQILLIALIINVQTIELVYISLVIILVILLTSMKTLKDFYITLKNKQIYIKRYN